MGYHASSAEEVYRYVFRRDRYNTPTLSDGFSWSILFVNDNSQLSRDFLREYGTELCYRTADRIRFVFFSGLNEDALQEIAGEAQRGGGFLSRIINATVNWKSVSRRYDWEHDDWDALRPTAFRPLDSHQEISRQISFEAELYTAMPGSSEAHRLAQTLGVGRFVPCFLLFSDVGAPHVHLLPVARKTPDELFRQLRKWIDSFYEINHLTLVRWRDVEKSIEDAIRKLQLSVSRVADWKQKRQTIWKALQTVSKYLEEISNSSPSTALLRGIIEDQEIPWQSKDLLRPFLTQLEKIDQRLKDARELKLWLDQIRTVSDLDSVGNKLSDLAQKRTINLPEPVVRSLSAAIRVFRSLTLPSSPEAQLTEWWRSEFGRLPSKKRYQKNRLAWVEFSKMKHGAEAIGNIASILKNEFTLIQDAIGAQAVDRRPAESARVVIDDLAAHLNVNESDPGWESCISSYREELTTYFRNLKTYAPTWLIDLEADATSTIFWRDCLPTVDQLKAGGHRRALEHVPRLQALVRETMSRWESHIQSVQEKHREQQRQSVEDLIRTSDDWLSKTDLLIADQKSVWLSLMTSMSGLRQDLENVTFKNAKDAADASYPGDVLSASETSELSRLLDEYDRAVRSIEFPFQHDPEVLRIGLETTLYEASGLSADERSPLATLRLQDELLKTSRESDRLAEQWHSIRTEARNWSPAGKLLIAMKNALDSTRLSNVLSVFGARADSELDMLTDKANIVSVLESLTAQELVAVENDLTKGAQGSKMLAATKRDLHDSILSSIGLLPHHEGDIPIGPLSADKLTMLRDKVNQGTFDIFLAHNSHDKSSVLLLGEELRRNGIYPWIDVEQIPPGRWFQDVIQSAVRTVKTAAIVIGQAGLGRWQALEMRVFVSRCVEQGITLIPILLPGVSAIPEDLAFLRELDYVRFTDNVAEREGLSRLVWGITGERP